MSTLSKLTGSAVLGLALLVPAFALAQTSAPGILNVYLQVINQSGQSYTPGNFTVSVAGNNPSLLSFIGSQSGTIVSLSPGAFVVTVPNAGGYTADYSVGCNNTIAAGQSHTCVITMRMSSAYNYSTLYPYPYTSQPALTCRTDTPTVGLGQTARFTAVGGIGGTYNWAIPTQNYPNVGPVLTVSFQNSGSQVVSVTNGPQTAHCNITVTTSYYPQPTNTVYPGYSYPVTPAYNQTYPYQAPYQTQTYYPRLPNTGFAPSNGAEAAFAVVLLMGAAIAVYPYARKAFAFAVR